MFKITQNTLRGFTLAQVLLMAAMNQLEATQKAFENEGSQLNRCPYRDRTLAIQPALEPCN
jgi:hypothetical protein